LTRRVRAQLGEPIQARLQRAQNGGLRRLVPNSGPGSRLPSPNTRGTGADGPRGPERVVRNR
jgi:hypothetical protein